jgi:drug/metabolite transporter (DMT)-like permease
MPFGGNMSAVISLLISVTIGVIGQLIVKKGLNLLGNLDFSVGLIRTFLRIFYSPYVILGSLVYFFATFFWLYGLAKVDLSFAYPFLALSYMLVILTSWLFLSETIPFARIVGVLVICFGVFLVAKS